MILTYDHGTFFSVPYFKLTGTYWSIFAMFSSDKWHSYSLMLNKIFHFCTFFYISVLLKMIKRYPAKWSRIKGSPVHSRAKSDILNSLTLKNVKFWYRNRVLESYIHIVIRACHKQIINQIIGRYNGAMSRVRVRVPKFLGTSSPSG